MRSSISPRLPDRDAVRDHYATLRLPEDFLASVHDRLDKALADEQGSIRDIHAKVSRNLKDLDIKEERLIDLAADGTLPQQKIRTKLHQIHIERLKAKDSLTRTSAELTVGREVLKKALNLIEDPQGLYDRVPDNIRRMMNQSFFEKIYVNDNGSVATDLADPFDGFHAARIVWEAPGAFLNAENRPAPTERRPRDAEASNRISLSDVYSAMGSNKTSMVELRRFELLTSSMRTKRSTN